LQAELDKAGSFLAKSNVYSDSLAAQMELTGNKQIYYGEAAEDTVKADDGAAMMKLVKQNLCQQISVAMFAQANMYKQGIALIGLKQ